MPPASMSGKICIVTGANSGIGKETALGLAQMGARVVMVCRNAEKGKAALEEIRRESGSSQVDLLIADMSSQASVRALAEQIQQKYPRLDVLVNNAGGAAPARTLSADGIEMTLATNHLGPALLTLLLLDLLKASAPSRIINVSSSEAQSPARLDMNDLQFERRKYSSVAAYGQSKLLMNAFTFELARRLAGTGVTANCLHPGAVATNIWSADPLAAHRQADHRRGEAVHAEFKTGRRGVPVSRDLSRGGTSLRRILRQVQARQVQSSFAGSEVDGGSLAVHGKNDQPAVGMTHVIAGGQVLDDGVSGRYFFQIRCLA